MNTEIRTYWDANEHLHVEPYIQSENGILFAAYYWLIKGFNEVDVERSRDALGEFVHAPYNLSHDNVTGFKCLALQVCQYQLAEYPFPLWYKRLHPRDLIFWGMISSNVFKRYFCKLLSFIPAISMMLSCTRKTDNTSTKLLTWARLNTVHMPITTWVCTYLIFRKYKDWYECFEIYFKDKNHPIRTLIKEKRNEC